MPKPTMSFPSTTTSSGTPGRSTVWQPTEPEHTPVEVTGRQGWSVANGVNVYTEPPTANPARTQKVSSNRRATQVHLDANADAYLKACAMEALRVGAHKVSMSVIIRYALARLAAVATPDAVIAELRGIKK